MTHSRINQVTERIIKRSQDSRDAYLQKLESQRQSQLYRSQLSCGNLAHGFAACSQQDKSKLSENKIYNLGIVSAYNEMLSAHQPYGDYPEIIREQARASGATSQFAGGVPAMCDGVTQGLPGMELSLFSRDHIAMSTAIALSHQMFDGALYLGICDKIVPGLLIGALAFGHLPGIFIPAGPMNSGIPNKDKARVRQLFAQGKVDKKTLLQSESLSYHSPGTCTFYGTANSNQMLMEIMGLQLPGSSFENPDSNLRDPMTRSAVKQLLKNINIESQSERIEVGKIIDAKAIVNGIVGLLATGGSTNHTIHLIAIARAAGIVINWQDMAELSEIVPLLCRVYPNGQADINHFHHAGGMAYLIQELLGAGFLHQDVTTVMGFGLDNFAMSPKLIESEVIATSSGSQSNSSVKNIQQKVRWEKVTLRSKNEEILRAPETPFSKNGGLKLLKGNLGRAVIKTSAVEKSHQKVIAPAKIFTTQEDLIEAFQNGSLNQDFVAVILFQGPKSNGMPELHKLTPILGSLQDKGFKVALVTDGRMSGASGKVPAAIHISPEAIDQGPIARLREGDQITIDCAKNQLSVNIDEATFNARTPLTKQNFSDQSGIGRELYKIFREKVSSAETGASVFDYSEVSYSDNNLSEVANA